MSSPHTRMPLVVHSHFHHRRTGVTSHTEGIVRALAGLVEARVLGRHVSADLPRVRMWEVLRRAWREPTIWHAHRNGELLLGLFISKLLRKMKVVFTRHGSYPPTKFTQKISHWPDSLICLNPENASWMERASTVIGHGVDLSRFRPPQGTREEAWARLGLGGRYGIGVVGRVRENKGQADFVEAVAPLLPQFPEWRGILVGGAYGKHEAWAKELVSRAPQSLQLVGEKPDAVPYYQGLSVLVNPSHGESFGLTLIEGMATGCCVVASKLSHVPTLIEHGRTGFLYEPRNVQELREVLEPLLREPARAVKIGQAAAEHARAHLGLEHEARAIAEVYDQVLSRR